MPTTAALLEDGYRSALDALASFGLAGKEEKPPSASNGLGEVQLGNEGRRVLVNILDVDKTSKPHRARVKRTDTGEELGVEVCTPGGTRPAAEGGKNVLLDSRSNSCVQDYEDTFELVKEAAASSKTSPQKGEQQSCETVEEEHEVSVSRAPRTESRHEHYHISMVREGSHSDAEELEPTGEQQPMQATPTSDSGSAWKSIDGFVTRMSSFDLVKDLQSAADATIKDSAETLEKLGFSTSLTNSGTDSAWERLGLTPRDPNKAWERLGLPSAVKALNTGNSWEKLGFSPSMSPIEGLITQVATAIGAAPSTFERAAQPPADHPNGTRVLYANVTAPVDLSFNLPDGLEEGQTHVCIAGPHGPLQVPIPEGKRPGELMEVRIGPASAYRVTVPEGAAEGDVMTVDLPTGERIQATVPNGKRQGDHFDISPPALMVQVPVGANAGDRVRFLTPEGIETTVCVPDGATSGQYFAVPLEASRQAARQGPASDAVQPSEVAKTEQVDEQVFE